MAILPITNRIYTPSKTTYNKQIGHKSTNPTFKGTYTDGPCPIIDNGIKQLKSKIDTVIKPYAETNKELFTSLLKIGYASQEKLKMINRYETKLIQMQLDAVNSPKIKQNSQEAMIYKNYLLNLSHFNSLIEYTQKNPKFATEKILHTIKISKPKMTRDSEEFKKLKPLYIKANEIRAQMSEDFNRINDQKSPHFIQGIKELDTQNKTAAALILMSDYPEYNAIIKEYDRILTNRKENIEPLYRILERIEDLNNKIQNFEEQKQNKQSILNDISNFVNANKDYETNSLSARTIQENYNALIANTQDVIDKNSTELENYRKEHQVNISQRIIDRTLKMQDKINKQLNILIAEEKRNLYYK